MSTTTNDADHQSMRSVLDARRECRAKIVQQFDALCLSEVCHVHANRKCIDVKVMQRTRVGRGLRRKYKFLQQILTIDIGLERPYIRWSSFKKPLDGDCNMIPCRMLSDITDHENYSTALAENRSSGEVPLVEILWCLETRMRPRALLSRRERLRTIKFKFRFTDDATTEMGKHVFLLLAEICHLYSLENQRRRLNAARRTRSRVRPLRAVAHSIRVKRSRSKSRTRAKIRARGRNRH